MKTLGALSSITAVAAVVLTVGPASAATASSDRSPGVVTAREYNHAQLGQSYGHIARSFGTHGKNLGLYPSGMVVKYRAANGTHVYVTFSYPSIGEKARLVSKVRGA